MPFAATRSLHCSISRATALVCADDFDHSLAQPRVQQRGISDTVTARVQIDPIAAKEKEMALILVDRVGQCAVLTLNRPAVLNALNTPILDELDAAIDQVEASD